AQRLQAREVALRGRLLVLERAVEDREQRVGRRGPAHLAEAVDRGRGDRRALLVLRVQGEQVGDGLLRLVGDLLVLRDVDELLDRRLRVLVGLLRHLCLEVLQELRSFGVLAGGLRGGGRVDGRRAAAVGGGQGRERGRDERGRCEQVGG